VVVVAAMALGRPSPDNQAAAALSFCLTPYLKALRFNLLLLQIGQHLQALRLLTTLWLRVAAVVALKVAVGRVDLELVHHYP
jgi:hypothetical protein